MKFKSLPALELKIEEWEVDRESKPLTVTSLAYALGMTRETLLNFEEGETEYYLKFSPVIKRAKLKCHMYAEDQLYIGKTEGAKFNLKNNWKWKDKTEVANTDERSEAELDARIEALEEKMRG